MVAAAAAVDDVVACCWTTYYDYYWPAIIIFVAVKLEVFAAGVVSVPPLLKKLLLRMCGELISGC